MNLIKKVGVALITLAHFTGYSQDSTVQNLTLKQAIELAIKNNVDVRQSALTADRAKINLRSAKASFLPDLNGNINHGSNQGRSIDPFTNTYINQSFNSANYSLNSGLVVFNGLFLQNQLRQNALAYDAAKLELQQQRDNVTLDVIIAYLQILNNEDQLTQAKNQAELSTRQVERLTKMNQDGAISPSELFDVKGQLASDQLSAANSKNSLETAKLNLFKLLNLPYNGNLKVERLSVEQIAAQYESDLDKIYQTASTELALVKAAVTRSKSTAKAIQTQRSALFPQLTIGAGISTTYSSLADNQFFTGTSDVVTRNFVTVNGGKVPVYTTVDNFRTSPIPYFDQLKNNYSTSVGIGLRIPILNALSQRNRVSLAKIEHRNAEVLEESTKIQLRQNIEQAFFNMTTAFQRLTAASEMVAAYAESFRGAEVKFNAGAINSVDYLVAKNNLDRSNLSLIIARYDYVLRTKVLDYYQAKPLW